METAPATAVAQPRQWAVRAASAERAIVTRHLRRVWGLPGTLLAVCASPATPALRMFEPWNYWWQAHVLDCLVDAYIRAPLPVRRDRVERLINGIRARNARGWRNDYYDDMAWLALALDRAQRHVLGRAPRASAAVSELSAELYEAWTEEGGGGIWWRAREKYQEDFKNVPTNGPAAILFARLREPRAYETARWIETHLVDDATGIVWDGLHVSPDGGGIREIETARYTYVQGVFLGACVELARWDRDGAEAEHWAERATRTIDAVAEHLTTRPRQAAPPSRRGRILRGQGGGDGGLFAGILARYLAQAAIALPEFGPAYDRPARTAADLVLDSARAAWSHAAWGHCVRNHRPHTSTGPVFGAEWSQPARLPRHGGVPERDLSVQVSAWMLMEAAALLQRTAEPAEPAGSAGPPR